MANRCAHALQSLGVQRGDRVAICAATRMECPIAQQALSMAGAASVLVNSSWKAHELNHAFSITQPTAVVADTDMLNNNYVVSESGLPNSNNADFVINALDNITGGTALLELRGRGLSFRPFTTVEAMERAAQAKFRATEEQRQRELDEAQSQLKALQGPNQGAPGEFGTLTQAQQETIARANRRILQLREQLRDVRASLNADIEDLQKRLQVVNILLIPILVALAGVVYAVWRRVRLSRYIKKQAAA